MYPDEISAAEAVLRIYPEALLEKTEREAYLQSQIGSKSLADDVRVDGGGGIAPGERYAIAADKDARLQCARKIISAVKAGMSKLNQHEDRIIRLVLFDKAKPAEAARATGLSDSYVRALLHTAKQKAAPPCIYAYPLACKLRYVRDKEHKAKLRALRENEERQ